MKQDLIKDVIQGMLPYLNNAQNEKLQEVLKYTLAKYEVTENQSKEKYSEQNYVELFLSAKRIEGCSEKSLKYYKATIEAMLCELQKDVKHIVTDDIRGYLTEYQEKKKSSKVTIDNIRRILSSFFSWLEDEDYILKSPVRRIHRVKTGTNIKETYSDEALELMRDNCTELRDLLFANAITSVGFFSFLSDHSSATSGNRVARSLNPASTLLWEQYGQPVLLMLLLFTVAIHSCSNLHFHITFLCEPIDTSVGLILFFSDHSEANSGFNVLKSLMPVTTLAPEHIGHFSPLERAFTLVSHS